MKTIRYHDSIVVAKKVINELNKILPSEQKSKSWISSWSHGREQGFCVVYYNRIINKSACIAECRSSDEILVIVDNSEQFDIQTNQPSESAYENHRAFFRCGNFKEAAKHIKAEMYSK